MRRAFADTFTKLAEADPKIAFITGDLGFQVFDEFERRWPERYINAGVAEAQMIYTAAGMALEGWKPVAYSIASFATARPFEQIRYCLAYPNLPVILVGAGRGYLYSTSGISHHAGDDLGIMSALPGMTVVAPGDPKEVTQLLPQLFARGGPSYFTVGKFGEASYEAEEPAVVGKARLLRRGEGLAILSTGEIANEVLKAVDLLHRDSIFPAVYQFHTVKPLDTKSLEQIAARCHTLLVVEEHVPQGGLWAGVCSWASTIESTPRIARCGMADTFAFGNLKQDELRKRFGFNADAILERARRLWDQKPTRATCQNASAKSATTPEIVIR